ncbi:hypothetical protein AVEN_98472-1 [Araneus ventricosus]|uniref:Uncharacterized protein n=1 Tax=Araneus ventricosus TaxID=182803 RepID=A0A4Y2CP73_ARAVE|nr:hypothetical protein AVEN_98472-1 [Araneus ventricosus]
MCRNVHLRLIVHDRSTARKLNGSVPKPIVNVKNMSELPWNGAESWKSNLSQYPSLRLDCRTINAEGIGARACVWKTSSAWFTEKIEEGESRRSE